MSSHSPDFKALLVTGTATATGRRCTTNEDRHHIDTARGWFAISSGVSGLPYGERASDCAIRNLIREIERHDSDRLNLTDIVIRCHEAVRKLGEVLSPTTGIGATLTILRFTSHTSPQSADIAHIGDNVVYLHPARRHPIIRHTTDHTIETSHGSIKDNSSESSVAPPCVDRYLGQNSPPECEIRVISLNPDDRIILCSKGITRALDETEITDLSTGQPSEPELARALVKIADIRGGRNNATALIIHYPTLAEPNSNRETEELPKANTTAAKKARLKDTDQDVTIPAPKTQAEEKSGTTRDSKTARTAQNTKKKDISKKSETNKTTIAVEEKSHIGTEAQETSLQAGENKNTQSLVEQTHLETTVEVAEIRARAKQELKLAIEQARLDAEKELAEIRAKAKEDSKNAVENARKEAESQISSIRAKIVTSGTEQDRFEAPVHDHSEKAIKGGAEEEARAIAMAETRIEEEEREATVKAAIEQARQEAIAELAAIRTQAQQELKSAIEEARLNTEQELAEIRAKAREEAEAGKNDARMHSEAPARSPEQIRDIKEDAMAKAREETKATAREVAKLETEEDSNARKSARIERYNAAAFGLPIPSTDSRAGEWYYAFKGEIMGPIHVEELIQKMDDTTIKPPLKMIWTIGMEHWTPVYECVELWTKEMEARTIAHGLDSSSSPLSPVKTKSAVNNNEAMSAKGSSTKRSIR